MRRSSDFGAMRQITGTDLEVSTLCLGGNVFGWTADEATSHAVLDAYVDAGGNFIDTADVYSAWAPGLSGGESETVIGSWIKQRGRHDDVVIATKVAADGGAGAENVKAKAEASLGRLGVDAIDILYIHYDTPEVPVAETLGALAELVSKGKVRHIAASNFTPERLQESLDTSDREGMPRYVLLQPHYNLVEREYERTFAPIVAAEGLACAPYWALASGFLTGKYRPDNGKVDSPRAGAAGKYLQSDTGPKVLEALDDVAAAHGASVAAVALAWLAAQPTITSPIASARNLEQLQDLLAFPDLELTGDEVGQLSAAGA